MTATREGSAVIRLRQRGYTYRADQARLEGRTVTFSGRLVVSGTPRREVSERSVVLAAGDEIVWDGTGGRS
jgi:hypothetical protein